MIACIFDIEELSTDLHFDSILTTAHDPPLRFVLGALDRQVT